MSKRDASRCDDRDVTSPTEQRPRQKQSRRALPFKNLVKRKEQQSDLVMRVLKTDLMGAFGTDLKAIGPS